MQALSQPPALFLMGPTGVGKTELAAELVARLPYHIISVDSAMIYRGMDIGTAKPGKDLLARAPHRLIDIRDPSETYSAAEFRSDALREMKAITAEGGIPLLVGGTGLYFRTLERGISALPAADPKIRAELEAMAKDSGGWPAMHRRLADIDPEAAARIHPHDPQRIQRALEIYAIAGRPLTELIARPTRQPLPYRLAKLIVAPGNRALLHKRLQDRFVAMLERGLIEEVRGLYARGDLHPAMPALRLVGYRQVWQYLEGKTDYPRMLERSVSATRQLAKRQLTWLRAEAHSRWFDGEDPGLLARILRYLNPHLYSQSD